jgi:hypothetical protein
MALNSVNQQTCVQRNQKIIKTKRPTSFPSESPARPRISYAERCANDGVRSRDCLVENVDVVCRRNFVLPHQSTTIHHHHYLELDFATPEIARSQFRDAGNFSLSISRCRKPLDLNFATPEIARSQFCDAIDAGNRSLTIPRRRKSFALNFATPEIACSQFRDA